MRGPRPPKGDAELSSSRPQPDRHLPSLRDDVQRGQEGLTRSRARNADEEFFDTVCKNHSAALDLTEMQAPQQAFDYGTQKWKTFHDHATPSSPEAISLRHQATEASSPPVAPRARGIASA